MKYDIAAKVVIESGKEAILRRFLGIDLSNVDIIEQLPEETVSLRRSDFPLRVSLKDGREIIVLIEVQTEFDQEFPLRLIEYTVRFMLKYSLEVIPFVLVIKPTNLATGFYKDNILTFNYRVFRFWEEESANFLDETWLYPFLPLMKGGENLLDEIDRRLYDSNEINREEKANLLASMAIFAGFKNKDFATRLIKRRRDIMMESPAYEIMKEEFGKALLEKGIQEGIQEGIQRGIQDGIQQGIQEGIQQGIQQGMRQFLLEALEFRFKTIPTELVKSVNSVTDAESLKKLHHFAMECESLQEFERAIKLVIKNN